jgi:5-methylcytosine-specific restriction protein A
MAKKYCAAFPCSKIAEQGSSYCQEHKPGRAPKETDPFYLSVRWRRFRAWYLENHPLCELCEQEGRLTPTVMVDHVVELSDGGAPLEEENAMSMCWKCHGIKTALMKNHRRSGEDNR